MIFPAPRLSTSMKASTTFVSLAPLALVTVALISPENGWMLGLGGLAILPVFVWAVRQSPLAYEVHHGHLIVHARLGATHTLRLDGTVEFPATPPHMRLFGSSGFFGHTGWFLDPEGRVVRAFMSRAHDTVVVGTDRGPVFLSPADPEAFIRAVQAGVVR
ncbi:MAG: PH domain-containing protein [Pseudomonadota bacterium]|nr:PH domain-containing protein [Pseudomonadota bacterium]